MATPTIPDYVPESFSDETVVYASDEQGFGWLFFAGTVLGLAGIMRIFDHIWRFDTGLKSRLMRRWRR